MSALTVTVASLADEGLKIDSEVEGASLRPQDAKELDIGTVRLQGQLTPLDGEYLFQGSLSTTFSGICDRCLDSVLVKYETVAVWTFVPGTPGPVSDEIDADDTATYFTGPALDLGERAWEELVLAQPTKMLCRESCKGLCAKCGKNWNEGPCDCRAVEDTTATDSAQTRKSLAGLGELFPGLNQRAPED